MQRSLVVCIFFQVHLVFSDSGLQLRLLRYALRSGKETCSGSDGVQLR